MIVMKFGGTSVADAEAIHRMMNLVEERLQKHPLIVVSALSKVTDTLYKICEYAERSESIEALMLVEHLRERHKRVIEGLIPNTNPYYQSANGRIDELCNQLKKLIEVVCDLEELSDRSRARITSTGEYLSSNLIANALNARGIQTNLVDARKLILTDQNHLQGEPDLHRIAEVVPHVIQEAQRLLNGESADALITQGFVSATDGGIPTVLGRGGSDYTASLLGMAVGAESIEIWTDVDGIHTADPRKIKNTRSLREISYEEAAEMAHFGAKVLHPATIEPAVDKSIPITVLNAQNPQAPGTKIRRNCEVNTGIKSLSYKDNILLVSIFSNRILQSASFLSRILGIFSKHHLPIDLISTSESNVTITLPGGIPLETILEELAPYATVFVETGMAQLSLVGKELILVFELYLKIFQVLAQEKIYLISQGASLNNLNFVVEKTRLPEISSLLHQTLFEHENHT